MTRPGSDWVAVAWFSDQATASNVAAYLEASGVSAYTHAHASRALGSTPVFVLARELELARVKLRRFKTGDFDPDAEDGTPDALGLQLMEDLAAAPGFRSPSAVARWAPIFFVPVGIVLFYLFASLVASFLVKDDPPAPPEPSAWAAGRR